MHKIKVIRKIDTGHRVVGHEGKCKNLHGHTYTITVILLAHGLQEPGFVVDFGKVKEVIDEWDHKMLLWEEDPVALWAPEDLDGGTVGVLRVPFNPTAEHMAKHLAEHLYDIYANVQGVIVKVAETESTEAVFKCP